MIFLWSLIKHIETVLSFTHTHPLIHPPTHIHTHTQSRDKHKHTQTVWMDTHTHTHTHTHTCTNKLHVSMFACTHNTHTPNFVQLTMVLSMICPVAFSKRHRILFLFLFFSFFFFFFFFLFRRKWSVQICFAVSQKSFQPAILVLLQARIKYPWGSHELL